MGTPSPTDVPALISEAVTFIRSKGRVKSLDVFRGWDYFSYYKASKSQQKKYSYSCKLTEIKCLYKQKQTKIN